MKKLGAVVTGGGGYVGEKLCEALCERGYAVTALDVRYTNADERENLRKIKVKKKNLLHSSITESTAS